MNKLRPNHYFLFLYTLFIIYGSLFPLTGLRAPELTLCEIWRQAAGTRVSRSDLLTNFLVYIPFGFLVCLVFPGRLRSVTKILLATMLGTLLSFLMEFLQTYLPARTSSPIDLALNIVSTLVGTMAFVWVGADSAVGEKLLHWRREYIHEGRIAEIGLLVIALWGAAQLSPFVPTIDFGDIKNGLKPIWQILNDPSRFNCYRAVTYALSIASLGMVLLLISNNSRNVVYWLGFFCGTVLLCKVFINGRQLSLESITGLGSGVIVVAMLGRLPPRMHVLLGGISATIAFIVDELRPDFSQTVAFHEFNWIPFIGQMSENISGIGSILDGIWPFAALGFFTISLVESRRKTKDMICLILILMMVFGLEYFQTMVPGRYPDITNIILAAIGWMIPMQMRKRA